MKINFSGRKVLLFFCVAFAILLLGIYTVMCPQEVSTFFKNRSLAVGIGIVTCLTSSFFLLNLVWYYLRGGGIFINEEGIFDNSGPVSMGFMQWDDIVGIRCAQINSTSFLLIDLKNQKQYLTRFNKLKSWWLKITSRSYGTLASISTVLLDCTFEELENAVRKAYADYQAKV